MGDRFDVANLQGLSTGLKALQSGTMWRGGPLQSDINLGGRCRRNAGFPGQDQHVDASIRRWNRSLTSFLSLETIMEFIQHIFFQMTCMRESFPFVRGHYVRIGIEKEMYDPSQTVTVVFLPFLILQRTSPGPC